MAAPRAPWQKPWLALAALALLAGGPAPAEEAKPDPAATRQHAVASGLQAKKLYARAARRWQQFIESYPKDPRLAKKSEPVAAVDGEIQQLMDDMLETMYAAPGIGLAAPQVGVLKRVIVIDIAGEDEAPAPVLTRALAA